MSESRELRWGVLSTAWIAGLVAPSIREARGARLAGVASRDLGRAEAFACEHGAEAAFGDYGEMLDSAELDAIYIAVPNSLHPEWVRKALEAGKHVMCEKPLALSAAEARELFDLASERGLLLMEGFMYRHHPQIEAARRAVDEGEIGELLTIGSTFFTFVGDPDNIRFDAELGGGASWDVGSYCVSFSLLFGGAEPTGFAAKIRRAASGVDDTFAGVIEFANGRLATFSCGIGGELRTEVTLIGSEKTLTMANPWLPDIPADIWHGEIPRPGFELRQGVAVEERPVPGASPYQLQFENFAAVVAVEAQPGVPAAETVATIDAIEALRRSAGLA